MPTLTDLLPITNCSRDDFNNWKRQDFLSAAPKAVAGASQEFTRAGALELGFFSALRKAGFDPRSAAREVAKWLRDEKTGNLAPLWVANPVRQPAARALGRGVGITEQPIASLFRDSDLLDAPQASWGEPDARVLATEATSIVIVNRREIVARIDALFETKE